MEDTGTIIWGLRRPLLRRGIDELFVGLLRPFVIIVPLVGILVMLVLRPLSWLLFLVTLAEALKSPGAAMVAIFLRSPLISLLVVSRGYLGGIETIGRRAMVAVLRTLPLLLGRLLRSIGIARFATPFLPAYPLI